MKKYPYKKSTAAKIAINITEYNFEAFDLHYSLKTRLLPDLGVPNQSKGNLQTDS